MNPSLLPPGIRSRFLDKVNGLRLHFLEAGFETPGRPCLLLLHGFPELAYSWRKVMLPLAAAGYRVLAPDQRGYGWTTGWDDDYDGDLASFRFFNIVRDALGLLAALGESRVAAVIGHDFGAPIAAWCGLLRPDVFPAVVIMSAPFAGTPGLAERPGAAVGHSGISINDRLASLDPPRKHYHWYYTTRAANADMMQSPQGLHDFLRAYYHHKSADWKANRPHPLLDWSAEQLGRLPTYYVMPRDRTMPETVAAEMPTPAEIAACHWLSDAELAVYVEAYRRTGFQGGLNWYRCRALALANAEQEIFAGRRLDVPACFIAGSSDWGMHQAPGAFEAMQRSACSRLLFCHRVDGAGHWVQQEQPEQVSRLLLQFLERAR